MRRPVIPLIVAATLAAGACDFQPKTSRQPSVGSYSPRRMQIDVGGGMITAEPGAAVSVSFFRDAGVNPLLGRVFQDGDASLSFAVLGEDLWRQRFDADVSIIGRELEIDQRRMTVVGVMPTSFQFPEGARLWVMR